MKKFYGILLAALLTALLLSLAGCQSTPAEPAEGDGEAGDTMPSEIVVAGGEKGTSYSNYAAAVYGRMNEVLEDIKFPTGSNTNLVEGLRKVEDKTADITLSQGDLLYYATHGEYYFAGREMEHLRAITSCYSVACQIFVPEGFAGESPADLKGKRVAVGEQGSLTALNAQRILGAYGLTEDNTEFLYESLEKSVTALEEGEEDAVFCMGAAPITSFMKLSLTHGVGVLPIEGETAQALREEYPYFVPYTVPEQSYTGQERDVDTLGVRTVLVVNQDVNQELVYVMTRVLFENKEAITEANAKGAELHPQRAAEGVVIPFHGGAIQYLNEIGVPVTAETNAE